MFNNGPTHTLCSRLFSGPHSPLKFVRGNVRDVGPAFRWNAATALDRIETANNVSLAIALSSAAAGDDQFLIDLMEYHESVGEADELVDALYVFADDSTESDLWMWSFENYPCAHAARMATPASRSSLLKRSVTTPSPSATTTSA